MNKFALATISTMIAATPASFAQDFQAASAESMEAYRQAQEATVDAYITGRLITAYALTEQLETADIHVFVRDSHAILTGLVENAIQEELAEEIARGMPGLDKVESDLIIKPSASAQRGEANETRFAQHFRDAAMKARIKTRLMWNKHVSGLSIDVITNKGDVTLLGAVDSPEQAALAEAITENTHGVERVSNKLSVQTASNG